MSDFQVCKPGECRERAHLLSQAGDKFSKVDRALELLVLDWLQWGEEFDEQRAALALELIAKRKDYIAELDAEVARLRDKDKLCSCGGGSNSAGGSTLFGRCTSCGGIRP